MLRIHIAPMQSQYLRTRQREDVLFPGMLVIYWQYDADLGVTYAVHSAVISGVSGNTIICKSKWGAAGLFEHALNNVTTEYGYIRGSRQIACTFYSYATTHNYSFSQYDQSTHKCTCTVCGTIRYDAHVVNPTTHRCKVCNYDMSATIFRTPAPRPYEPEERVA